MSVHIEKRGESQISNLQEDDHEICLCLFSFHSTMPSLAKQGF